MRWHIFISQTLTHKPTTRSGLLRTRGGEGGGGGGGGGGEGGGGEGGGEGEGEGETEQAN